LTQREALRTAVRHFFREAQAPRLRTPRQFAEQEIIIPDGPFKDLPFRVSRQPIVGLWLREIESSLWNRFIYTWCVQAGKSFAGFVFPIMFHLFEIKETVIVGVPTMDMAGDKWQEDILPVIERSRYRDLLPRSGAGSRGGGKFESIRFLNGTTLKFMSGQGGDEKRSGFTSRVVVVTEADKMDEASGTSRETDPIRQLEARTVSFGQRKRVYLECTTSIDTGRIWQEYTKGSASRILSPCVHCGEWVAPEREHFVGFEDAATAIEAGEGGRFCCPSCGEAYSDAERTAMVGRSQLAHGQQVIGSDGAATGDLPKTRTLGFRGSAFHNLFWTQGEIAERCWIRERAEDEDSAEKELCQFTWVKPYVPPKQDLTPLVIDEVIRRQSDFGEGQVPDDVEFLTLGCDVQKYRLYWTLTGWSDLRPYEVEYGQVELPTNSFGVERALGVGFSELWDKAIGVGWTNVKSGRTFRPQAVWIDAQHWTETVEDFCRAHSPVATACHGRGTSQYGAQHYGRKTTTGKGNVFQGEQYHIQENHVSRLYEAIINVDHWKSEVHRALETPRFELERQTGEQTPREARGSFLLHKAGVNDHRTYVKHLTAEKQVQDFVKDRGMVLVWKQIRKQNHWLDATMLSFAAGHFCGWRPGGIIRPEAAPAPQPSRRGLRMPDGRAFLLTER
jgi:hypothetical protein